jgi:hypothetical protein
VEGACVMQQFSMLQSQGTLYKLARYYNQASAAGELSETMLTARTEE